ncbi:ATP-binding protein [Photobacterium aquimaris]|uniref:YobI family P-loop NTPase n=1 Tax=Photobacterium aquimaris TaxID=512643 RepID=UPI002E257B30
MNTSNSIDMVLEQEKRLAVGEGLDRQFLREVSRYLNDLRLIQNIFNEYAIYVANLETDGENILDGNKLLAVLIYKNVYPRDFEQLHRGEGALAKILDHQAELINKSEDECRAEIVQLEKLIEVGEDQTPLDLDELRKIYAMALIEKLPSGAFSIGHNSNNMIEFQQLATHSDLFEGYLESSNIYCRYNNNYNTHVNIKNWHTSVNSQKTYYQRKEEIKNKAEERKVEILGKIRDLRLKLPVFRTTKLSELLRLNSSDAQVLFEGFGENGELARFLILESFLDDTYYQYTSLFHSGRMSPNDNKYLIQIRAFITPEPDFPIDNPHEVIAAMREEDFGQSYVLNMVIVDALLSDKNRYKEQVQKLYSYIKIEFESCEHFLDGYYTSGHNVVDFLLGLNDVWDRLVPSILTSNYNIRHITQLVKWLPLNSLKSLAENFDDMSNFVSEHLLDILCEVPELDPNRLVCLNFEVKDLLSIKEHSQVVCTMFEEGLFELSIGNLEFIYKELLAKDDVNMLNTKNYTTILSTKNSILIGRVERDFEYYLRNILLVLDNNSEEDLSAILVAICHDEIELSVLSEFLKQQVVQLPTLEKVPDRLYTMIFDTAKIKPTWANCLTFMDSDSFRNETLVKYLDKQSVCDSILEEEIPSNSDSFNLHTLLINANSMSDYSYKGYVCALPNVFKSFPSGLDLTKIKILIEKRKINFTKNNFNFLENTQTLQVLFVSLNIDMFLDNSECFDLSDDFLEHLLQTEISEINKFNVIKFMNLAILVDHHERAALIGSIVVNDDTNYCNVDGYIAKSIIMYSSPTTLQILLFNKYCTLMTNSDVREVLSNLPKPYCEITTGYHTPRLKNSLENKNLVMQLDHQNIISSWTIGGIFTDEIKVNLYRKKEETV